MHSIPRFDPAFVDDDDVIQSADDSGSGGGTDTGATPPPDATGDDSGVGDGGMNRSYDGSPYSTSGDSGPVSSGSEPPQEPPTPSESSGGMTGSSDGAPYSATGNPGPVSSTPPEGVLDLPDGVYVDPAFSVNTDEIAEWIENKIETGLTAEEILHAVEEIIDENPMGPKIFIDKETLRRFAGQADGA